MLLARNYKAGGHRPPLQRWLDASHVRKEELVIVTNQRNVIVHIATSADGYIARTDGDLEWLAARPAPAGFYGMEAFMQSIDTKVLGRKTYEAGLRMGAKVDSKRRTIVFDVYNLTRSSALLRHGGAFKQS